MLRHDALSRLTLLLALLAAMSSAAHARADADGWQTLFDGTSLDAWRVFRQSGEPQNWTIDDGALYRAGGGGDLITREKFGDFELEFEWKIGVRDNSGVIYRHNEQEDRTYKTGPEYQVLDHEGHNLPATHKHAAASMYDLYAPATDAARPAGEWNSGRIVWHRGRIEHWLNGEKVVDVDTHSDAWRRRLEDSKFAKWPGFAQVDRGHIALQDHGDPVWYRNIRIRPLDQVQPSFGSGPSSANRLLFVTQSEGFRHPTVTRKATDLSHSERVMTELGIRSGLFRVDCTQDVETDFKRELLEHYDIVMFYTTGNLPIDQETLDYFLNDWLKQPGRGFIGVHSAADTYHDYEPYWDMLGGTFDGHPWNADAVVTISVHDTSHPVARPWGEEFTIQDEIYQFKNWQPEKVRVLMSLNMEKTAHKEPRHVPIAWVKEYGEGKVMHMSLGHREEVWSHPTYQESLLGGVRWILGLEPGDATPNPELSEREQEKARAAAQ